MKVYLAARTANAPALRGLRDRLHAAGHTVTSRWLDLSDDLLGLPVAAPIANPVHHARQDLEDLRNADAAVFFLVGWKGARGGMHFEAGYALALGKRCATVGLCPNIFYALPGFTPLPSLDAVAGWLDALESA